MIKVSDLSFSYKDKPVLKSINFEGGEGEVICLLGPNGVGKTTLFKTMLNILKPSNGSINIKGKNIALLKPKDMAKIIAYVPQGHSMVFNYRVIDVVLMGMTISLKGASPSKSDEKRAYEILTTLGIEKLAYRGYENISGGERQLVLIGRALAQNTKMLIMDEPTANLDYGNSIRVMKKVASLSREGYTIMVSTHNPEHALLYGTKAIVMLDGKIEAYGNPHKVLTRDMIKRVYRVDVDLINVETYIGTSLVCVPLIN